MCNIYICLLHLLSVVFEKINLSYLILSINIRHLICKKLSKVIETMHCDFVQRLNLFLIMDTKNSTDEGPGIGPKYLENKCI